MLIILNHNLQPFFFFFFSLRMIVLSIIMCKYICIIHTAARRPQGLLPGGQVMRPIFRNLARRYHAQSIFRS